MTQPAGDALGLPAIEIVAVHFPAPAAAMEDIEAVTEVADGG
jgi:hypothetical protein